MAMARLITGLSRAKEQQEQERLFVYAASRIERALRLEIRRAMREMADVYDSTGKLAAAQDKHRKNMERILERGWRSVFDSFGTRILDAAEKSHRQMERKELFGSFAALVTNWIRRFGAQKVTEIIGTTRDQAMEVINEITKEATREGLAQAATGRMIKKAMDERSAVMSVARSRVIARTETHAASQAASHAAIKSTGLPAKKEWISASGSRTRDDHADADGQLVSLDKPFIVGGEELQYPGDPSGSAANVINCRCASGIVVE